MFPLNAHLLSYNILPWVDDERNRCINFSSMEKEDKVRNDSETIVKLETWVDT